MTRGKWCGGPLLGLLLALVGVACSSPRPEVGGETHWLRSCYSDDECGDELDCICGSCSRACATDAKCEGGRAAACYDHDSPLLLQRCAGINPDVEAAAGVCLPSCTSDAQCSGDKSCVLGACVPASSLASDAGDAADGSTGTSKPGRTISDFDDVAVDVPADDEVQLPVLSFTIDGQEAASLVGTWNGQGCSPPEDDPHLANCPQLVITAGAAGVVSGFLQFSNGPLPEPFPPATDPDVGYPPGLRAAEVGELRWNARSGIHYPLRDARFQNGTLTFLWSTTDLYQDWCALQTPQPWTIEGHGYYFCAPQDPAQLAKIDPIKRMLCVSATLGPWCTAGDGSQLPCACLADEGPTPPECTSAVCRCERGGCEADTRSIASKATLAVDGNTMTGGWEPWSNTGASWATATFEREAP